MKQCNKLIILLLTITMLLTICSCANSINENHNDESSLSQLDNTDNSEITNDTKKQPSDTTSEQPKEDSPILADLNHDGTDDKIIITYDNEQKNAATIKVINGKDDSVLMTDTLILNSGKTGAYYLQLAKGSERDRLVFWHYGYLASGNLAFNYSVFSYESDGKIIYGDRGGKTFDVSFDAAIASGNHVFLMMREEINENIQASRSHYDGYLLLDNQEESLLISTADNMLAPTDLLFGLEDFVVDTNAK